MQQYLKLLTDLHILAAAPLRAFHLFVVDLPQRNLIMVASALRSGGGVIAVEVVWREGGVGGPSGFAWSSFDRAVTKKLAQASFSGAFQLQPLDFRPRARRFTRDVALRLI